MYSCYLWCLFRSEQPFNEWTALDCAKAPLVRVVSINISACVQGTRLKKIRPISHIAQTNIQIHSSFWSGQIHRNGSFRVCTPFENLLIMYMWFTINRRAHIYESPFSANRDRDQAVKIFNRTMIYFSDGRRNQTRRVPRWIPRETYSLLRA